MVEPDAEGNCASLAGPVPSCHHYPRTTAVITDAQQLRRRWLQAYEPYGRDELALLTSGKVRY